MPSLPRLPPCLDEQLGVLVQQAVQCTVLPGLEGVRLNRHPHRWPARRQRRRRRGAPTKAGHRGSGRLQRECGQVGGDESAHGRQLPVGWRPLNGERRDAINQEGHEGRVQLGGTSIQRLGNAAQVAWEGCGEVKRGCAGIGCRFARQSGLDEACICQLTMPFQQLAASAALFGVQLDSSGPHPHMHASKQAVSSRLGASGRRRCAASSAGTPPAWRTRRASRRAAMAARVRALRDCRELWRAGRRQSGVAGAACRGAVAFFMAAALQSIESTPASGNRLPGTENQPRPAASHLLALAARRRFAALLPQQLVAGHTQHGTQLLVEIAVICSCL